jgi:drug/metabolite transporter (DMT)-like permease
MAFFKKYSGTAHVGLIRMERIIWTLIYGGLLAVVLGVFMLRSGDGLGYPFAVAGGLVSGVGVVLIYVRSRLREE